MDESPNPTETTSPPTPPAAPPAAQTGGSGSLSLQALRYSKLEPTIPPATPPAPDETVEEPVWMEAGGEPRWRVTLKAAAVFTITFVVVFGVLESPALIQRANYALAHLGKKEPPAELTFLPKLQDRPITVTDIKNRPQEYLASTASLGGYTLADLSDNTLLIPKISVNVPIIWKSPSDEQTMLANLQNGVAHYDFTALPSDGMGNVFISGHSSYLLWDPGKYKTVFANLDRLEIGDQLAVTYQGVVYIYEVADKKVVKPDDVSVLNPTTEPTLSLMTCVPVGTNLNRLVVSSKLISASSNRPIPLAPPAMTDAAAIFYYLPF